MASLRKLPLEENMAEENRFIRASKGLCIKCGAGMTFEEYSWVNRSDIS